MFGMGTGVTSSPWSPGNRCRPGAPRAPGRRKTCIEKGAALPRVPAPPGRGDAAGKVNLMVKPHGGLVLVS